MALKRMRRRIGTLGKLKKKGISKTGRYVIINGKAYPIVSVRKKNIRKDEASKVYGKPLFG